MSFKSALEHRFRFRRIEQQFGHSLLIRQRQTNDLRFRDGLLRRFLRGGDHEIADAAALNLGGALYSRERLRRDADLKTGRPGLCFSHGKSVRQFTGQFKNAGSCRARARAVHCRFGQDGVDRFRLRRHAQLL